MLLSKIDEKCMKIIIHARPNKKSAKIEKIGDKEYKIDIDAPAKDDKANQRLIEILAEYLKIHKSQITIKIGFKSHLKIIEIL